MWKERSFPCPFSLDPEDAWLYFWWIRFSFDCCWYSLLHRMETSWRTCSASLKPCTWCSPLHRCFIANLFQCLAGASVDSPVLFRIGVPVELLRPSPECSRPKSLSFAMENLMPSRRLIWFQEMSSKFVRAIKSRLTSVSVKSLAISSLTDQSSLVKPTRSRQP